LRWRFGLSGTDAMTLEEIGMQFAVTRERIRQIEARALSKLRKAVEEERKLYPAEYATPVASVFNGVDQSIVG